MIPNLFFGVPLLASQVLLSILATSFLAHYNAPLFYEQLDPGPNDDRAGRFRQVSILGFAGAGVIFSLVMLGVDSNIRQLDGLTGSPGKSQKEGQKDQRTLKQLRWVSSSSFILTWSS